MKKCNKCLIEKTHKEFTKHNATRDGLHSTCRKCLKNYNRQYYLNNSQRIIQAVREKAKTREGRSLKNLSTKNKRFRLKMKVINAYGGKCACCGETKQEFLALDHVYGDGGDHRRQLAAERGVKRVRCDTAYQEAVKAGYPDSYRILCMNCNFAYGAYGYCPHTINL